MQQNQQEDPVCIEVGKKLDHLPPSYECCIFRVYNELRQVNNKAYEPNIIAIGPYHHGKENLMMMEEHKLRYLSHHLGGNNEKLKNYVLALRKLKEEACRCYVEPPTLNEDEWVRMMLLDGCFIIELVRKYEDEDEYSRESKDPIFEMDWIFNTLQCDLLLFENQLPFFVLCKLFDMIEGPNKHPKFVSHVQNFFNDVLPSPGHLGIIEGNMDKRFKHLLGVVHNNWRPPLLSDMAYNRDFKLIHCVTELRKAGIKFEKGDDRSNLFNIEFKNGVLQIPSLTVKDRTETVLRNLMAYEQYCEDYQYHFISDYVNFFDCLINSPDDVRVLCRRGIIDNWLGDEEEVSSMFNKLTKLSIVGLGTHFYYSEVFEKINAHYGRRANRWMEKLRRNYIDSPWAIISIQAAIVLLLLTFLQTLYTIMN